MASTASQDTRSCNENDTRQSPLKIERNVSRSKGYPWYQESFRSRLTPECRELLETYSEVQPADVERHIHKLRDEAWEIFPFPCIGEFWFLTLGLSNHPYYQQLLVHMKAYELPSYPTLIDIGTCFGQDLRKLVFDGIAPFQLLGADVFLAFEKIGHDFFLDASRFSGRFREADLFSDDSGISDLVHSQDVITSTMFLHSFDWNTQALACRKMLQLARGAGSWLMGGLCGSLEAGEHWVKPPFVPEGVKKSVYRHDRESFIRLWKLVATECGVTLSIFAEYESRDSEAKFATEQGGGNFFTGYQQKLLWYSVRIVGAVETDGKSV